MATGELFEVTAATILSAAPNNTVPLPQGATSSRTVAVLPRAVSSPEGPTLVTPDKPRYETLKRLGEGSFGAVDLVLDNDIDRLVALKRLRPDAHDADTVQRFADEIQIVGKLEHPGIVTVHDVGLDERGYFFVMKYLDGEDLETIIRKLREGDAETVQRFPMEERARVFLATCRAVEFAHNKGLIHRDIKPGNIMVGRFGEVVLMDWGLAKRIGGPGNVANGPARGGDTQTGTMLGFALGTPAYMPPEQARGEHDRTDRRADVYSLCATFFELFTLRHYLEPKADVNALLEGVKNEEPMSAIAMHHKHQVPPEYTWILQRGLMKDPDKRFQSVPELASRIVKAMEGRNPVECPCTGLKRVNGNWSRFIDRYPYTALFLAAFAVASALVGVGTMVASLF
jgi:serine/threonine-protein kinase